MIRDPIDHANWSIPDTPGAFLLRYIRMRPWRFGLLALVVVSAAACAVVVQYSMKLLVDGMAIQEAQRSFTYVWLPFALFIGLIAVENVLWRSSGWLGSRTIIATCADLRVDLFTHLTGHSMRYFSRHSTGALGTRISATGASTGSILSTFTWSITPPCVDFLGAIVVFLIIDWRMAAALVVFVALVATIIIWFGIRGRRLHQHFAAQSSQIGGEVVDLVSNVWTIKAFSARRREREHLAREIGTEARAQRRSWLYVEKARVLHDICLWLMAGSMLLWALWLWTRGSITPGDVVVVSALTFRILHGSRDLALALVDVSQQFGAIADTLEIIARPHDLKDPPGARTLDMKAGRIDIERIAFHYPDGQQVFEDLTLHIPAGQKVGIVGASGAGKTTLTSLIQRLDDVQSGRILIDGQPIDEVTQDSLRAAIAVVPQESTLFHRSILENIRYGRPDASDEEVIDAARHAHCEEFIRELPQGYETQVGERGVRLSGGQRQRLGIARAFLKGAPILILDEPTSALDTHSEHEIQQALGELVRGRTVIAVAHRLSTLSTFDRIVVMQHGRIVEDGAPHELRRQGGIFESLWRLQADGFIAQ
ncbi:MULTISPECIES: ABC transporter ATP-binding protein [Halomonadaceae]|uniref:ABC transporter ATP-binding protein n=1 Tax=Halomonadaceae TaxID=28256 RepID=UPI0015987F72|nr:MULTISPECIES: ABC transporter ATP-binding protein [Halomonas]QJQ93859.1 ABC transporter ATP-binding protein [Halomonas sp. PA5]